MARLLVVGALPPCKRVCARACLDVRLDMRLDTRLGKCSDMCADFGATVRQCACLHKRKKDAGLPTGYNPIARRASLGALWSCHNYTISGLPSLGALWSGPGPPSSPNLCIQAARAHEIVRTSPNTTGMFQTALYRVSMSALSRHRRRHVYFVGMGVPVLKITASEI